MAQKTKNTTNKSNTTLIATKKNIKTNIPLLNTPDAIDPHQFDVTAQNVTPDQIDYTDTNFKYDKVSADQLANRFMTTADYTLLDPADVQSKFGDINRVESQKNADASSQQALQAIDTELQGLLNYAPTAANLQRQQVALDNTTNQSEKTRMLDAADPNIRGDLSAQRDRFSAYAEGRVPNSITDRQLELGIQSNAADQGASAGFGVGSSASRKAGQLMSAEERVKLSQYGDQSLSANIAQRNSTLLAPQQLATGGASINVNPSFSAGQASMAIASQLNQGNITAKDALSSEVQQQQFKSGLEQDTNKTNLTVQSQRDLNQAHLNLTAGTTNADNSIRTQIAGAQIQSSEKQFNANLNTNTAVANADRNFNAANANAGRALETVTSNRAVKLEVDKTNKTMVFQDQQRIASQNFSAGQAAAAQAGANARAAMSASGQAAAIAAQTAAQDKDRAFQLEQQKLALDVYKENRGKAQNSSDWGAIGNGLLRLPNLISFGSSLFGGGGSGGGNYGVTDSVLASDNPITSLFSS